MKKLSSEATLEVFYQERELTDGEKILKSPDRSPNFRGAREMGVGSNGDFEALVEQLLQGKTGEIGEKITVRRFVRYELGDGIEKEAVDFAAEVMGQVGTA